MNKQQLNRILEKLYESEKELLNGGVIRTTSVVGELGEYYASKKYGLDPADRSGQRDYDLKDKNGKCYQVKTRRLYPHPNRTSKQNLLYKGLNKGKCDIIFVLIDEKYKLKSVFSVSRKRINGLLKGKSCLLYDKLREESDNPLKKI